MSLDSRELGSHTWTALVLSNHLSKDHHTYLFLAGIYSATGSMRGTAAGALEAPGLCSQLCDLLIDIFPADQAVPFRRTLGTPLSGG